MTFAPIGKGNAVTGEVQRCTFHFEGHISRVYAVVKQTGAPPLSDSGTPWVRHGGLISHVSWSILCLPQGAEHWQE